MKNFLQRREKEMIKVLLKDKEEMFKRFKNIQPFDLGKKEREEMEKERREIFELRKKLFALVG